MSSREGSLQGTSLMLIVGLALNVFEQFKIVMTRLSSRQQYSTATRLENNLLSQKDMKCVQLIPLSRKQLIAEAGDMEFLSSYEIPSTCSIRRLDETNNDFVTR